MSYDGSIVGVTTDGRVVYDYDKMVEELMEDEGWSYEEATEWINYNTIGGLPCDKNGPIIMWVMCLTSYPAKYECGCNSCGFALRYWDRKDNHKQITQEEVNEFYTKEK